MIIDNSIHYLTWEIKSMSPENFAYWLKGFFELTEAKELTPEQVAMIKEHLNLVFNKVTSPLLPAVNPSEQITFPNNPFIYEVPDTLKPDFQKVEVTCINDKKYCTANTDKDPAFIC